MFKFSEESSPTNNSNSSRNSSNVPKPNWSLASFINRYVHLKNKLAIQFLAELFGTTIFVMIGLGSAAQYILSKSDHSIDVAFLSVNVAVGFSLSIGIIITAKASGGHLNPCISLTAFLSGQINFLQFLIYMIAQFFGAFIAAFLVFFAYFDSIKNYPTGMYSIETAGVFTTFPNKNLGILAALFDQTLGSFILCTVFLCLTDKRNSELHFGMIAFYMGLCLTVIGASFGFNSGYAINPARDFSPRLFTLILGWGGKTFSNGNYFFWIPIVGPFLGSFFSVIAYNIFILN